MIDIQNESDEREIPLKKVGIKNLMYPVVVLDKAHKTQATNACVELFVNLPHNFKGTHMSRFIETFHKYSKDFSMKSFLAMLEDLRTYLDAEKCFGLVRFPFFIEKKAPVSGQCGMMCYTCTYEGSVTEAAESDTDTHSISNFYVSIEVPVTTLCPCSKAISDYGAHNQRGSVTVKVQSEDFFWIEDIIALVEQSASSGIYSVLKRQDEKFVTEHAYDNPRFVEDIVREVYSQLRSFSHNIPLRYFSVEAESFESIHAHNAYAFSEYKGNYENILPINID
ncbi:MAG: GTP cyclohydrolase FolE2 [Spirochaetales bacterium]